MTGIVVINGIEYAPVEKQEPDLVLLENYYEKELIIYFAKKKIK